MSTGSLLLGLALLVLVALYVARPLMAPQESRRQGYSRRQALLVHKEALLAEIRALDFDYETDKVQAEEYQQQRAALMADAVEVLKQLDALEGGPAAETEPAGAVGSARPGLDLERDIEAAVARVRQRDQAAPPAMESSAPAGFCPECGEPVHRGDKYCTHCGHKLTRLQPA
jgi:hypothetical protein